MSEETTKEDAAQVPGSLDPKQQDAQADAPPADESAHERPHESPLECAERERGEFLAKWQRARADYQNLRRRQHEDIQAAERREQTVLLDESLVILDYLDMALASPCESPDARTLQVGVQMTRDQLWSQLEGRGVAGIDTDGPFDTNLHQAVATVATVEHAPGQIVEVVRRGFTLEGSVLRYAQVKVATDPHAKDAGAKDASAKDPSATDAGATSSGAGESKVEQ
ncbi:MAG: nucleotide exchange factor GrpE, partial [Planctomycetota bacterium]